MHFEIKPPITDTEWEAYYNLRYNVLREPWQQPKGSEILSDEKEAIHAIAVLNNVVVAVGRLQQNSPIQGQVRCMAVAKHVQGMGFGKKIMYYLEDKAKNLGLSEIILDARENALPFYQSIGYEIFADSYLLFNEIQHWKMRKVLVNKK